MMKVKFKSEVLLQAIKPGDLLCVVLHKTSRLAKP